MRTVRYVPTYPKTSSLDDLQRHLQIELGAIARSMQVDVDEVGDSSHAGAGETGVLLWVNRSGTLTLDRVSIGAVDSGGAGYRVLRVAN